MSSIVKKRYSIENNKIVEKNEGEYYNKDIANKICNRINELNNGIENSFPELMILFENEINEKKEEIEILKSQDKIMYDEIVKAYEIVGKTDEFQIIKINYKKREKENNDLRSEIHKANKTIKELSAKLEIALNKIEELQNIKIGFWQRILLMFSKQKRLPSGKM